MRSNCGIEEVGISSRAWKLQVKAGMTAAGGGDMLSVASRGKRGGGWLSVEHICSIEFSTHFFLTGFHHVFSSVITCKPRRHHKNFASTDILRA